MQKKEMLEMQQNQQTQWGVNEILYNDIETL